MDEAEYRILLARARRLASGGRTLLGIAGSPGAGKSTLAERLVADLGPSAQLVPMDGFHLPNAALDRLGLRGEKGSPRTFDAAGYVALLRVLRADGPEPVGVPGFDRDTDEPVAARSTVAPDVRLIVTEGNYLLLDVPPWSDLRGLLDEVWFCSPPDADRIERLVARHVRFGRSPEAALAWATGSDAANALLVEASRTRADLLVHS